MTSLSYIDNHYQYHLSDEAGAEHSFYFFIVINDKCEKGQYEVHTTLCVSGAEFSNTHIYTRRKKGRP